MTVPNEVKFKVRHYALLLEEFTVSQIVELTGLKSPSVRTEVQRMKREGFVTASRQNAQGRGGPPCVYRLTDDPEARLALSRSVEAFYIETQ
jgi:predicted transcriptional regulator